jgi:hypothetical protein
MERRCLVQKNISNVEVLDYADLVEFVRRKTLVLNARNVLLFDRNGN